MLETLRSPNLRTKKELLVVFETIIGSFNWHIQSDFSIQMKVPGKKKLELTPTDLQSSLLTLEELAALDDRLPALLKHVKKESGTYNQKLMLRSTWHFWKNYPHERVVTIAMGDDKSNKEYFAVWEINRVEKDKDDDGLLDVTFACTEVGDTPNPIYPVCTPGELEQPTIITKKVSEKWLEKNYPGCIEKINNCIALGLTGEETAQLVFVKQESHGQTGTILPSLLD